MVINLIKMLDASAPITSDTAFSRKIVLLDDDDDGDSYRLFRFDYTELQALIQDKISELNK